MKSIVILLMVITYAGVNYSQTINCSWTTQDFPFETQGSQYSWSKGIYFPTQLNGAQTFTKVTFKVDSYNGCMYSGDNTKYSDVRIYLRHTSADYYTSATKSYPSPDPVTSGFTLVYRGDMIFPCCNNQYITLTFGGTGASSSFNYNGSQNLEMVVENRGTGVIIGGYSNGDPCDADANIIRTDYNPGGYNFGVHGYGSSWATATNDAVMRPYDAAIVFNNNSTDCLIPLPIELSSFTGTVTKQGTLVQWITESESNNDYYTLYRSWDGMNWKEIAHINGAGNSNRTLKYSFIDNYNTGSEISYYKLRQTDYDGEYSEFGPISIHQDFYKSIVYPNPASTSLKIISKNNFRVFNVAGKEIKIDMDSNTKDYNISHLDPGIYIISFEGGENVKFIKE
ncbi:MAG: T9SS type A sorting domain-containing protein [Brumimicrobium sp.]|nr:T9SS type A sorting domain-containing protein [Brumimicrobium sp.]